jgi:hypothetical protein
VDVAPATNANGVPSDAVPEVELISPQLRRDILRGKDINLATLLIPGYNPDGDLRHIVSNSEVYQLKANDTRIQTSLTIQEFVLAFNIYRNVMCECFPSRRSELDLYVRDVIRMSSQFGGGSFYEYHKAFAARAAALLLNHNIKLDWGKRDNNLFCTVFAGHKANACNICNSLGHSTTFCPQSVKGARPTSSGQSQSKQTRASGANVAASSSANDDTDRKGRAKVFHRGSEVCNDFKRETCGYLHVCQACKQTSHHAEQGKCQQRGSKSQPKDKTAQ